jgi:hypothetical protein
MQFTAEEVRELGVILEEDGVPGVDVVAENELQYLLELLVDLVAAGQSSIQLGGLETSPLVQKPEFFFEKFFRVEEQQRETVFPQVRRPVQRGGVEETQQKEGNTVEAQPEEAEKIESQPAEKKKKKKNRRNFEKLRHFHDDFVSGLGSTSHPTRVLSSGMSQKSDSDKLQRILRREGAANQI